MTILITGSKRGLGYFVAKKFIKDGYDIVTHSRKTTTAGNLRNLNSKFEIVCDLNDLASTDEKLETLKLKGAHLSHLICNAGKSSYQSKDFDCFRNIQDAISDNLIVVTNVIASALRFHTESLKSITIIGSICGEESIDGAPLEYSVAKSALKSLTNLTSKKLAKHNIRVNLITPGNLFFEGSVWNRKKIESIEKFEEYIKSNVPTNRIGNTDDIYGAIKFLISDHSSYVTGANLVVDGGQVNKW